MVLGIRNKNRAAAEAAASTEVEAAGGGVAVATAPKKKRKPQEMLSSVVKESTVGAAVALLKGKRSLRPALRKVLGGAGTAGAGHRRPEHEAEER